LERAVEAAAREGGFSGVVRVERREGVEFAKAYGLADRAHGIPVELDTRIGIASGAKGLTALGVMSMIEEGAIALSTSARSVLGEDLPLVADDVTVEHLLAHRSGIGDYLDENAGHAVTDYVMPVPVHELSTTESYLPILDGHDTAFPAGERFAYDNGGYVLLALIAERVAREPFHDVVRRRVCEPARMRHTEFLRSDELPGDAALGYLEDDGPRTNVLHLPVRGSGDGGVYSTAADVCAFWPALFAGRIVSRDTVAEMVRPRSDVPREERRYGLGFWLHASKPVVMLEGYDPGASFHSAHDPDSGTTYAVLSNTSEGAWPIVAILDERLGT
jgi:CubicO group peptidase (beta-lactamase class C family)